MSQRPLGDQDAAFDRWWNETSPTPARADRMTRLAYTAGYRQAQIDATHARPDCGACGGCGYVCDFSNPKALTCTPVPCRCRSAG